MRIKINQPHIGEKRIKTWFALLPVSALNKKTELVEYRWLEFVKVEQIYKGNIKYLIGWRNWYFID